MDMETNGVKNTGYNEFVSSLDELKASDFAADTSKAKKKKGAGSIGIISIIFILICAVVFVYCSVQIISSLLQYGSADNLYESYADQYAAEVDAGEKVEVNKLIDIDSFTPMQNYADISANGADVYDPSGIRNNATASQKFQKVLLFLNNLKLQNSDIYGYIDIAGTRISHPIAQSTNNDFYLNHGIDKQALKAGAIFVDFRCSKTITENQNTVIYGHNMSNGAMFHDLTKYLEESFFMNQTIVISTFDGIYTYKVFSIHEAKSTENYFRTAFYGDYDFISFCKRMESQSMYHLSDIEFDANSKILTLSTCIKNNIDGRYAIHAILINEER